jgi:hypothetical protein
MTTPAADSTATCVWRSLESSRGSVEDAYHLFEQLLLLAHGQRLGGLLALGLELGRFTPLTRVTRRARGAQIGLDAGLVGQGMRGGEEGKSGHGGVQGTLHVCTHGKLR